MRRVWLGQLCAPAAVAASANATAAIQRAGQPQARLAIQAFMVSLPCRDQSKRYQSAHRPS
jgi:replication-associated recombination protein RarA